MIVVATFRTKDSEGKDVFTDTYTKVEGMAQAREVYQEFLDRDELYSASICGVIESTDYRPSLVNSRIDYGLLKKQKGNLVTLNEQFETWDFGKTLEGTISLLDQIQDEAVDFGWTTEEEAFDLEDE